MITYNELYEALRKERYSDELQTLNRNFISDVVEYFSEKEIANKPKEDFFSEATIKSKKKLENAIGIFRELVTRRKKKILNLAFVASETGISKRDFEHMLSFEKELFESVVRALEKSESTLSEGMSGEKIEDSFSLVRFIEDVEPFLNLNGEEVGPFEKGEIANIDREVAEILKSSKKIEILEED